MANCPVFEHIEDSDPVLHLQCSSTKGRCWETANPFHKFLHGKGAYSGCTFILVMKPLGTGPIDKFANHIFADDRFMVKPQPQLRPNPLADELGDPDQPFEDEGLLGPTLNQTSPLSL
ncbi:hypothetical protein EV424DRAFT_1347443 [Suillus variegatus]|nr:hypothetical protein EV424DRAFT_1347443 [Suillus variegatus]